MNSANMAIKAAKNRNVWGRYATYQYLRNNNVPMQLYQLAIVLESGA